MTLEEKVHAVEQLFGQLDKETAEFQKTSGLACVTGCGKCCTFPSIEAFPLEFLPWAFHLYLTGKAEKMWRRLNKSNGAICQLYTTLSLSGQGRCGDYKHRGLICRLFGFAATTDKYGSLRLATCKIIKEGQAERYKTISESIAQGLYVPVFTEYYMQLNQIDFFLGNKIVPINMALKMALEEVMQYYTYRPLPDADKICG